MLSTPTEAGAFLTRIVFALAVLRIMPLNGRLPLDDKRVPWSWGFLPRGELICLRHGFLGQKVIHDPRTVESLSFLVG